MNALFAAGLALTGLGLVGYAAGTVVAYPGRAVSLTAVMAGVTLAVVGFAEDRERDDTQEATGRS